MPPRRSGRQRNRQRASQSEPESAEKSRDDGLLYKGKWYCNCKPRRREASRREVKKDSANKGSFYYTCILDSHPCGFWLWESKAQGRAETNFQPEEAEEQLFLEKQKPETQKQLTSFFQVTPGRRPAEDGVGAMETPCPSTSKRKRDAFETDEDLESAYGMDSEEDEELIALVDETVSSSRKGKAKEKAAQRDPYITPATERNVDVLGGLPTPSVTRTLFPASSNKRHKTVSFEESPELQTPSTCTTATVAAPTPSTPSQTATPRTPGSIVPDVSEEVMPLLQGQRLTPDALKSVREVLTSSARKTKGIVTARDFLRGELRERETKIAQLQGRVEAVENKNKLHNRQVTNIRAGIMKLHDELSKNEVSSVEDIKASLMKLYERN
ncbi:unnamed protein product [Clonostachys chloroleuca]|uniref:Zinc finger GRF-type domain-containing protein n=1 Tax=Clonostachys chloroleuca TaxID=1926264 RepID=A0AA35LSS7_9HYPO|nr:unnamed protein product [Clonostachys chloroleuca]